MELNTKRSDVATNVNDIYSCVNILSDNIVAYNMIALVQRQRVLEGMDQNQRSTTHLLLVFRVFQISCHPLNLKKCPAVFRCTLFTNSLWKESVSTVIANAVT